MDKEEMFRKIDEKLDAILEAIMPEATLTEAPTLEWSPIMPDMPPEPAQTQKTVGYLRCRIVPDDPENETSLDYGAFHVWWFNGFFYLDSVGHPQTGGIEEVAVQKLQIRDGKLYGRLGGNPEWDNESTGWQFAGWVDWPEQEQPAR